MKKFAIAILTSLCLSILFTSACTSNKILQRPEDTTLEFWVAEKVSEEDFKGHYSVEGVFGGYIYFGKEYLPNEITEENSQIKPDYCVTYTVTAYPDYSSNNGKFDTVTRIEITDPAISVYGITCNSTLDDFDKVFQDLGCKIQDKGIIHIATYGKTQIAFADYEEQEIITIWVEVTNKQGISF